MIANRSHLAESLLVGQCRYMGTQTLEGFIDALHATSLPKIRRLTLLGHLGGALQATGLVTAPPKQ